MTPGDFLRTRISALRDVAMLSPQQLAGLIGVSTRKMKDLESGEARLTDQVLEKICAGLNIHPVEFISGGHDTRALWLQGIEDCYAIMQKATYIECLSQTVVPIKFQTEEYIKAIFMSNPGRSQDRSLNLNQLLELKRKGQADHNRCESRMIISESALYNPICSAEVSIDQLNKILEHKKKPRILPYQETTGVCGPITIYDKKVVETELTYALRMTSNPAFVLFSRHIFQSAWSRSVCGTESIKLIRKAIHSHKNPESVVSRVRAHRLSNAAEQEQVDFKRAV